MAIFDITYVGDMPYLKLEGGTVTGATIFNSSVTANSGSITNNLAVGSINGVTVGSSPKFTDTTYSVATTSANGLLPALGGGTTNYLRADGSWAKPPGTTYSVATTSANGLMAAADKVAVNKIGSGSLNTTNQTIIPAINELLAGGGVDSSGEDWIRFTNGLQICWTYFNSNTSTGENWVFPKSFSSVPYYLGGSFDRYRSSGTLSAPVIIMFGSTTVAVSETKALVTMYGFSTNTSGMSLNQRTGYAYLIAIGPWK